MSLEGSLILKQGAPKRVSFQLLIYFFLLCSRRHLNVETHAGISVTVIFVLLKSISKQDIVGSVQY